MIGGPRKYAYFISSAQRKRVETKLNQLPYRYYHIILQRNEVYSPAIQR